MTNTLAYYDIIIAYNTTVSITDLHIVHGKAYQSVNVLKDFPSLWLLQKYKLACKSPKKFNIYSKAESHSLKVHLNVRFQGPILH